jgi:hypothetical protein
LLQGKEGEDLAEVKSLLLQVDQALGSSRCLLMGTLANFTLSKRREILEKSSVNEILQDSLLRSPLSDKVFGLSKAPRGPKGLIYLQKKRLYLC